MKTTKSLLLICLLFLGLVLSKTSLAQYITPAPSTYSTIATGSQTLTGQTTTTTQTWFKWVADTGVVAAKIKVTAQGTAYQTVFAEMYVLANDTIFLSYRDSINADSTFNLYAGYVKQNANIFIRIVNTNTTCTVCTSTYPVMTLSIQNYLINCQPVTTCDLVRNGGFEHFPSGACGGIAYVNGAVDCWIDHQGTADVYQVGCPSSIDLGTNTIISPTIPINTSNPNPHNTVIGFLANLAWEEAAQSSLTTPLLSGHTYQVQIWAYNVRGTWDGTSPPQSINTGPTTFAPYFTIGSSSSTLPSPPPLSFYPTSAVNVLNTFTLTGANNTWQQYTATFTHSATTHSNLLIGLDYGKNFASGYLTNNQLYAVIDEISIKDITPLAVIGNTICSGTTGTLTALGASSYTWQPGSIVSPTITTTTAGVYTVTGSYAAGQTCTVGPVASTVTILPSPTVNITASSQTICAGNIVTLTANGTGLQFQYLWTPYQTYYVTNTISVTPTVTTTYTVLAHGTAAGNCPATSTITIYVVPASTPTINITATPTLICGAGSTTLTASGAITYTWNPGAISGASVSVTPTATTVYTVQGSACGFTSTKTITITVAPNPTITVNSATICAGNSATLTANGGTTYYWAPSVVTPSIVVSPTVTTGYMVLGFDSNGCPGTAVSTVSVIPNTLPGAFTINTPVLPIIANGTGTNTVGFTTSLTNTVGLGFAWSNGVTTPTASYGITQSQIVSLNVSTPFCGTTTQSICVNYVAAICADNFSIMPSSVNSVTVTNVTYKVPASATITVSGTVYYNNCTFLMGTNSAIVITAGSNLVFQNSKLYSCDGMWYGIKTLYNATDAGIVEFRNTSVEDAYKAVDADNALNTLMPKVYANGRSVFNKNYIDFSLNHTNVHNGANTTFYLEEISMTSQTSTTSPGTNLKCSGYYTPTIKNRSYAGIYAVKAGDLSVTSNTVYGNNVFKNKDYGMYLNKTNADVYNANFMDIPGFQGITVCGSGGCVTPLPTGVAIYSNDAPKYLNVKPLGGSTTVNTFFSNVGYGILTSKTPTVDVQYCSFDNTAQASSITGTTFTGNTAIYTLDNANAVRINKNTINRTYKGVSVNYSVATTTAGFLLSVSQNTITAGTGTLTTGIDITSVLASPFNGTITSQVIAANTITNANSAGIRMQSVTGGLRVSGNTITLKTGTSGYKDGIYLNGNNSNVKVDNNNINGNLTGTVTAFNLNCNGIRSVNSAGCKVQCNYITNVGKGIEYNGGNSSPGDGFFKNTLQFPIRRGLVLSNGGLIGMQGSPTGSVVGASANQWTGAWPTPASTVEPQQTLVGGGATVSNAANSPLWVRNTSIESPYDNYFASPSLFNNAYSTLYNSIFNFTTTINDYATCAPTLTVGAKLSSSSTSVASNEDRDADFLKYINTLLPAASTSLTPQDKFMLKQFVFEDLEENPSANVTLQNFYNQQVNTSVGVYNTIDELLAAGNIALATTKNTQAPITNDITQTQNSFNTLYINGINTQTDFDNLQQLANLCPNQYGNAVFKARALLQILTYQYVEYSDSCYTDKLLGRFGYDDEEGNSVSVNDNVYAKLFPNPNNGSFTISYDLKKNNEAVMVIVDVTGKEVYQSSIDNLETIKQINTNNLQSGIYFVQLRNQKTLLWTDKLMITK